MNNIVKPTCREIIDEELVLVESVLEDTWRHGVVYEDIYYRESDQTYWSAVYRVSHCGETNELREGDADIAQVEKKEVTKHIWVQV